MSAASDLRRAASLRGSAGTEQAGWTIMLTRPGYPAPGLGWMLSGKRKNGAAPNAQNLAFLRRFAVEVGAPDVEPEQPVAAESRGGGTWMWTWEPTEEEVAAMRDAVTDEAERVLRESRPEDLLDGTSWSQAEDPVDPRFVVVTMRFPTKGMPLARYQGREAVDRMRRWAEMLLAGMAAGDASRSRN